jgi:hypothetical protein
MMKREVPVESGVKKKGALKASTTEEGDHRRGCTASVADETYWGRLKRLREQRKGNAWHTIFVARRTTSE